MDLTDLLAALKARWKLELAVTLLVLGLVAAWTATLPRVYTGTATLLFDQTAPDPGVDTAARAVSAADMLGTQADVIRSQEIATQVARATGLADSPGVLAGWRNAGGQGAPEEWLGRNLLQGLAVEPGKGSTILSVNYKARDPDSAAQVANSFAQTYLSAYLRMTTDPARAYTRWFEERTREVRGKLETAQNALTNFQRAKGIVSTENLDAEAERFTALSTQLAAAEGATADAASRTGGESGQSPDVQSSGVVQGLRSQIAQKTADVSNLRTSLGPNHPDMIAANSELAALRGKLASEVGATSHSLNVASGDAAARTAALRRLVDSQRGRMLALSTDRSQLEVLQRDVQSARAAFDAVTQRLSAMRLQAELPRTNVRLLDRANPPTLPSSPNVPLRMVLGLMFGAGLAMTLAGALEWLRPRVRTDRGLLRATGVPVLLHVDLGRSRVDRLMQKEAA